MKLLSRVAFLGVAIAVLAAPVANAAPKGYGHGYGPSPSPYPYTYYQPQKPGPHHPGVKRPAPKHNWKKGNRYSDWKKRPPVRDYHRHGLRRPAPGQQWIKVDNDYLLIGIATGLIASVIAGR